MGVLLALAALPAASVMGCAGFGAVSLPEDWPADVVPYPDAPIVHVSQNESGSVLVQDTSDSAADVHRFYAESLGRAGWSVERGKSGPSGESSYLADHAKTGRAILFLLFPLETGTRIEFMMSKNPGFVPKSKPGKRRKRRAH
ncbi:MAG: hypothetical protein HRU01_18820 [Myxococcales bacterium]|nr:hypothetical protein [Myxococcales bacterium]